jgi:hypothetical protein
MSTADQTWQWIAIRTLRVGDKIEGLGVVTSAPMHTERTAWDGTELRVNGERVLLDGNVVRARRGQGDAQ